MVGWFDLVVSEGAESCGCSMYIRFKRVLILPCRWINYMEGWNS
jgi:hypothetical protein